MTDLGITLNKINISDIEIMTITKVETKEKVLIGQKIIYFLEIRTIPETK